MARPLAVFIDRDGVINDLIERGSNFIVRGKKVSRTAPLSYSEFKMKDKVAEAMKMFEEMGFLRILISNQPDVSYGILPEEVHEKIMSDVAKLPFTDIFLCMHGRDEGCLCKKPKPGMLIGAAKKWNINLLKSYMIGDSEADMGAALAVNCVRILVRAPYNTEVESDYVVDSLFAAAELIKKIESE